LLYLLRLTITDKTTALGTVDLEMKALSGTFISFLVLTEPLLSGAHKIKDTAQGNRHGTSYK